MLPGGSARASGSGRLLKPSAYICRHYDRLAFVSNLVAHRGVFFTNFRWDGLLLPALTLNQLM